MMNRGKCAEIQRLISDGIDSTLPRDVRSRVQQHLAECAECANFERAARKMGSRLGAMPHVHESPAVREQVLAAVYRDSSASPLHWHGWIRQGALLAVACLAFVVVAVVLIAVVGSTGDTNRNPGSGSTGSTTFVASPTSTFAATPTPEVLEDGRERPIVVATPTQSDSQVPVIEEAVPLTPTVDAADCHATDIHVAAEAVGDDVHLHITAATNGHDCSDLATISLIITDGDGNGLVFGNGSVRSALSDELQNEFQATFLWTNWCYDDSQPVVIVNIGGPGLRVTPEELPACSNTDALSVLTMIAP